MPVSVIGVKQLNTYIKTMFESDIKLNFISVKGEISNFKRHFSSGHWYFTLKDSEASIRCIMFSSCNMRVDFVPTDGVSVIIKGRVSVYEKEGQYQLYVEEMHPDGIGTISAEFFKLKEKLQNEGLFDADNKRPIVKFPRRIAVVTSGSGAAAEDIKNVLSRRYPLCDMVLCCVSVQGRFAAKEMISVLDRVYLLENVDTLIIGRGGGSAEDLAAFNDEKLVRKIYESPFPVISAVGHETDFTLCDFVSDLRAPTPSAAAELAVPNMNDLILNIFEYKKNLSANINLKLKIFYSEFNNLNNLLSTLNPENKLHNYMKTLDSLTSKCIYSFEQQLSEKKFRLSKIATQLDALSPLKTLSRGYSAVECDDKLIKSVSQISLNKKIKLTLSDGCAECTVDSVTKKG